MANTGDLAFIGMNLTGGDDIQLVALADIPAGQSFTITHRDFIDLSATSPALGSGPGFVPENGASDTITWTTTSTVPAGTVITFNDVFVGGSPSSVSDGTVSGDIDLILGGDTFYIFQGSFAAPDFITGVATHPDGFQHDDGGGTLVFVPSFNFILHGSGVLPAQLTEGTTALNIGAGQPASVAGFTYTGDRSTEAAFADYLDDINGTQSGNFSIVSSNGANANADSVTLSDGTAVDFELMQADTTAPGLANTAPGDNAVDVAVDANIVLTFNENVQPGDGVLRIFERGPDDSADGDDVLVATIPVDDTSQVTINGSTVTINPAANLDAATRYFVEIDPGFVLDAAGNPFAGLSAGATNDEEAFDFVTALPPLNAAPIDLGPGAIAFTGFNAEGQRDDFAIVALTDLNGSSAPFQIFFTDREFNGTSFAANDGVDQDGTLVWTIDEDIAAGTVINFSELGITNGTPFEDFAADRGLLQRGSGVFTFEGGVNGDEIYAYTGSADTPSAFLGAISTEAVAADLTNTGLVYGQTAADFGAVDAAADAARYVGDRATQTSFADYLPFLNSNLANDFEIEDDGTSGEGFSPFDATPFTLGGTDTTAPNLVSISPADEEADVLVSANIVLTFNENVIAGSGNITIREFSTDEIFAEIAIGDPAVSFNGTTVTVDPVEDLAEGTRYYIEVDDGAITDNSGNAFAGITDRNTADFSTVLPTRGEAPGLAAGSIAFTGFNFDQTEDDLAIVVLEDLDGATEAFDIFFSDRPWNGTAFTDPDELDGTLRWTVNEFIAAGTVVTFSELGVQNGSPIPELSESHGLITRIGDFAPEQFGDTVYAYTSLTSTGDDVPAQFLAALTTGNNDAFTFGNLDGTGLIDGQTALDFSDLSAPDSVAAGDYIGARDGETAFADYLPLVNDIAEFTVVGTASGDALVPFDTTAFTLETPDLTVVIDTAQISEGDGAGAATVTVMREGDTGSQLIIDLASSDQTEAVISPSLIINAGSASASINLDAVDDMILDGTQTVTITASALGFNSGSDTVDVTDDEVADMTPPDAPGTPDLVAGSDTGASNSDDITNATSLSLTTSAEIGAEVAFFSDIDGALGTVIADANGNVRIDGVTLSDEVHSITAIATDAAGNASQASEALVIDVDLAAPAAPSFAAFSDDTGTPGDQTTADDTPTFTLTAEVGSVVEVLVGTDVVGSGTADLNGNATVTVTQQLDGVISFTAQATDLAGNTSDPSLPFLLEIDTEAPDAPDRPDLFGGDDSGPSDADNLTNVLMPEFFITGAEAGSTLTLISDIEGVIGTGLADGSGTARITANQMLGEGIRNITVTATDAAGNPSPMSPSLQVEFDTTGPRLDMSTPADGDGNVPVNRDITLTFDEAVFSQGGTISIREMGTNTLIEAIDLLGPQATISGNQIILNPSNPLPELSALFVEFAPGSVIDLAGNDAQPIGDLAFTTGFVFDPVPTDNDDQLIGTPGPDQIDGLAGDDLILGLAGNDSLEGNDGDDTIFGHGDDDMLFGGAGEDSLEGGQGEDTLFGGLDDDRLNGGQNDDKLFGGDGADELRGAGGLDMIFGGANDDVIFGGRGNDMAEGGAGDDEIRGDEGSDELRGDAGEDVLRGDDGNDLLFGGTEDDVLNGGDGRDSLFGGTDDDLLRGGAEGDILDGGDGMDMLRGEQGDDTLFGGDGEDDLRGGLGDDQLGGGDGDDIIAGNGGTNFIAGEGGDDLILAGGGSNTIVFGDGEGNDTITAFGSDDTLFFELTAFDDIADVDAALSLNAAGNRLTLSTGAESVVIDLAGGDLAGTDVGTLSDASRLTFLEDLIEVIDI
ncbi:MAG: Ig-like domain-containing protein [Pseudomonadota bacterium]